MTYQNIFCICRISGIQLWHQFVQQNAAMCTKTHFKTPFVSLVSLVQSQHVTPFFASTSIFCPFPLPLPLPRTLPLSLSLPISLSLSHPFRPHLDLVINVISTFYLLHSIVILVKILSQRSAPYGVNKEQKEYLIFLEDDVWQLLSE